MNRENVGDLQLVWTRALVEGAQEGTPLAYGGVLFMPNPKDHLQAIDAVTGDLKWEYRRDIPEDVPEIMGGLTDNNRNVAIYGKLIIDTSNDDYVYALDATSGELVWETQIFDYQVHPARHSSGPIIARGRVISGRSCRPRAGPVSCVRRALPTSKSTSQSSRSRSSSAARPAGAGPEIRPTSRLAPAEQRGEPRPRVPVALRRAAPRDKWRD